MPSTHHSSWKIIFLEQPFLLRRRDFVKSSAIATASYSFTSFSPFPPYLLSLGNFICFPMRMNVILFQVFSQCVLKGEKA